MWNATRKYSFILIKFAFFRSNQWAARHWSAPSCRQRRCSQGKKYQHSAKIVILQQILDLTKIKHYCYCSAYWRDTKRITDMIVLVFNNNAQKKIYPKKWEILDLLKKLLYCKFWNFTSHICDELLLIYKWIKTY